MVAARTVGTRGVLAVLAVGLLVTACGGDSDSSAADDSSSSGSNVTASDLDGSRFQSTSVEGHDLVAGSDVRLTFEDSSLSANAGCNTMNSSYDVTDGVLAWSGPPMATMMGCSEELMNQDTWLSDLLEHGADATLEGDDLTLVSGDVTLQLQRETAEPAADFLGKTWTVTEIITGSSVALLPAGATAPTFQVEADGTVQLNTGCNSGSTKVTAEGDTLQFEPAALTMMACPPPASEIEQAVLQALEGSVAVTVDGATATLNNGSHGLVLQSG